MHVVIYLPYVFYAGIASTIVETLQTVNDLRGAEIFSFEFVAKRVRAKSKSGIQFSATRRPTRRMDVLVLLAGLRPEISDTVQMLEKESERVKPLIQLAHKQGAIIATTCGAAYLLAASGLLDGKRATISWWLKKEARLRFPQVQWQPQRLLIRQGKIYTTGAAYAGLELVTRLLIDLGLREEERQVRKLMVLPPSREFQSPYEIPFSEELHPLEKRINKVAKESIQELDLKFLARYLGTSPRTLSRRFFAELQTSPGKWIQEKRLETARTLLETTKLTVAEVCYKVGYQDVASFSRLFSKSTGMAPSEFRSQLQS